MNNAEVIKKKVKGVEGKGGDKVKRRGAEKKKEKRKKGYSSKGDLKKWGLKIVGKRE